MDFLKTKARITDVCNRQLGIVPTEFTHPVKVNEETVNLKVVLKKNHKKMTYEVQPRLLWSQYSDNPEIMGSVFKVLNSLTLIALEEGEKWRLSMLQAKADEESEQDEDQLEMGFEEVGEPAKG